MIETIFKQAPKGKVNNLFFLKQIFISPLINGLIFGTNWLRKQTFKRSCYLTSLTYYSQTTSLFDLFFTTGIMNFLFQYKTHFMIQNPFRSLLIFTLISLNGFVGQVNAQQTQTDASIYQRMTINNINAQQEVTRLKMMDEEVQFFDVAEYLETHSKTSEIQLRGTIMSEHVVTKLRFDSESIDQDTDCTHFCQQLEKVEKIPFLGVSTTNNEAFDGITINKIINFTAAENAGLQIGDIITLVDDEEIRSGCDLRSLISTYEIGDLIEITFFRNQRTESVETTLGYRMIKSITWKPCCDQPTTPADLNLNLVAGERQLELFPNPSNGMAQMQYTSSENGPLSISITDVSGRTIFHRAVKHFDGFYNTPLDISKEAEGIYFLHVVQADQIQTQKMIVHKQY